MFSTLVFRVLLLICKLNLSLHVDIYLWYITFGSPLCEFCLNVSFIDDA